MKAFAFGLLVAFACPSLASAQSSIVDFSKPMTGQAQFVVRADGQPIERGAPAKVEAPVAAPVASQPEPDPSAAPIIRPAYLKPDAQMASLRSRCSASGSDACSSGTSRPVRVNVVVNSAKAEEKPKSAPRFRIGRRR
jgi:hypothetical protein